MADIDMEIGVIGDVSAPVFQARGWTWLDSHIPGAAEIASMLRGLLAELERNSAIDAAYEGSISSGRFHVELGPDEDEPERMNWSVSLVVGSGSYRRSQGND